MEMQQKAKEEWILLGDKCSKHFYKLLKARANRATICEIENEEGEKHSGQERIAEMFEQFFFGTLGTGNFACPTEQRLIELPFYEITKQQREMLTREVTDSKIRDVFINMDPNRSPGPDGWNAQFFKEFWGCIRTDVSNAIKIF